jgi:SMC interacting uncharacterized protein involved in chromosome segregation
MEKDEATVAGLVCDERHKHLEKLVEKLCQKIDRLVTGIQQHAEELRVMEYKQDALSKDLNGIGIKVNTMKDVYGERIDRMENETIKNTVRLRNTYIAFGAFAMVASVVISLIKVF